MVSKHSNEMSRFVTWLPDNLQEECYSTILHENMNIYHLVFHDQQLEEARAKSNSRDAKRANSFDSDYSKGRLEIQENSRFKKRVTNKVPSKFPKARYNRVSKPNSMKGKNTISLNKKTTCAKCGKGQVECLVRMGICFGFG